MLTVAADVALVVSKSVGLEGAATVETFPVRAFLVGATAIFGAEDRFWRES